MRKGAYDDYIYTKLILHPYYSVAAFYLKLHRGFPYVEVDYIYSDEEARISPLA